MEKLLRGLQYPQDIKRLNTDELTSLSQEIRTFLISSISETGGHIGANLGVIELTIALHYVFDITEDKIIFDTGHQGYTHKLLTGRKELFKTLNQQNGMSRFLSREESDYDLIDASHAGTAISIATGIAFQMKSDHVSNVAISLVGDGSMVEGMSAEGLNFGASDKLPLIIVVNDNGMSIPPNVGGIKNLFSGDNWVDKSKAYFTGIGYNYLSVSDGHNLTELVQSFRDALVLVKQGPVVVHVKTEKGKGLEMAKTHPYKMHFSMPFNPETGEGASPTPAGKTYAVIAGKTLYNLLKEGKDITILTPSTPYASGLDACLSEFPDNTIDVGMAEQHAVGMASGLALSNKNVFICFQATFMQRALDQIIHDACYMNLPITILAVRSGFAGLDSHTHHGIYDISFLRGIPNLKIFYPGSSYDLEEMIKQRAISPDGPMVILHPYEQTRKDEIKYVNESSNIDEPEIIFKGKDGYILSVGNTLETSIELRERLMEKNIEFGLVNVRWIKPLPIKQLLKIIGRAKRIITTEENVYSGGFGSSIAELICDHDMDCKLLRSAINDCFVEPGNKDFLSKLTGIDANAILDKVRNKWSELF